MDPILIVVLLWLLSAPVLLTLWILGRKQLKKVSSKLELKNGEIVQLQDKYSAIISVEDEVERLEKISNQLDEDIQETRRTYAEKREFLDRLKAKVAVYDDRLAFAELGVYEPHFDFGDSEVFKEKIKEVRARQKAMVSAKEATVCPTGWTVDGSRSKGQTMVNRQTRLTMSFLPTFGTNEKTLPRRSRITFGV